jgi:hypothetical protein
MMDGQDVVIVRVVAEGGTEDGDLAGFSGAGGGGDRVWDDCRAGRRHLEVVSIDA